ncbi:MAG: preprotein translocase subunit SecG [Ruminococcaceae bacterium]|nr:preprotein translocase subunit SecG [Oscillospiraceae bacterium]
MSVLEIIAAILLILACVFIILVVLMQDSKQGMSQTISGASGDNYYQKNSGRTKEARLAKMTKGAAIVVFIVALLVNLITIYGWGKSDGGSSGTTTTPAVTTTAEETTESGGETAEDTSAEETSAAVE